MKIVYILGNGFDVNLNLETKYTDFYKMYKKIESKNDSILKLKKSIETEKNWSDLESALGEYSQKVNSASEFIELFEDIGDNLADYLKSEERKIDSLEIDKEKFLEHLSFPDRLLPLAQRNQIKSLKEKWKNHQWNIYAITLNYTQTFEKIIGEDEKPIETGTHHQAKITYQGIQHLHGYIDDMLVMGVNDISQIKNESFHNNSEILNAFIKEKCNQAMQHTVDEQCKLHISSANLICIFGSSLGITDKLWWENIGERLKGDCFLIIFSYSNENIPPRREYKKEALREGIKNSFLEKTNLTEKEKEFVYPKIFVGINRNIFKVIKTK
jgi:hypothetical protein